INWLSRLVLLATAMLAALPVVAADIELTAPDTVAQSAVFEVHWSAALGPWDTVVIARPEDEPRLGGLYYLEVRGRHHATMRAPDAPGRYEIRYMDRDHIDDGPVAVKSLRVVPADIRLSAPEQVLAGAQLTVNWSRVLSSRGRIAIVRTGANAGATDAEGATPVSTASAGNRWQTTLTAPVAPGDYQIRYLTHAHGLTLASRPLQVVPGKINIRAPEQVTAGDTFEVSWGGIISEWDRMTIVPADAEEGTLIHNTRVGDELFGELTAPHRTGAFEVRYVRHADGRTMAAQPVEVVSPNEAESDAAHAGTAGATTATAAAQVRDFLRGDGYSARVEPDASALQAVASGGDKDMSPLQRSLLLFEAVEGELPRVRYKVAFHRGSGTGEDGPDKLAFIELERFNLGPTIREEVVEQYGGQAAPPEVFGVGPHVGWRIVMAPGATRNAEVTGITRRELSNYEAKTSTCFDISCLSTSMVGGPDGDWRDHPTPGIAEPDDPEDPADWPDDSAAAAAGAVSRYMFGADGDGYGEHREGVSGDDPELVMVISQDVAGQDPPTNAVIHETGMMDDAIAEMWTQRLLYGP